MIFVLSAMVILAVGSVFSALVKNESGKISVACIGASLGSAVGLLSAFIPAGGLQNDIVIPTNISLVSFSFGIDPLSGFFLMVIFGISFLTGLYALGYLRNQRNIINTVPFFPLLVAAMAGVVISRDGFSFLIIWEIMSLVSFFLVTSEHESKEVQNAGWIYLIATHIATVLLMAFFCIMAKESGSFLFSDFVGHGMRSTLLTSLLFVFAIVGFGTKAGIFPFHVWLPHAHPAAPSYISAIMSGVMIKTGIYGILRALTFLGEPPLWWGGLLVVIGVFSAVLGVLYALMQHDLKRLLAYHSVENIGIIIIGIGIGMLGVALKNPLVAVLGLGGAIFHVMNHAIFKSLLFLCAGNVAHAVHTLSIDRAGGLLKKLYFTGPLFFVAAMSICGLPPFNGFISEWIIYIGLFKGSQAFTGYPILVSVLGVIGIAFAGGLAVACFAKVFGIVFLGEARGDIQKDCREPSFQLLLPMMALGFLCVLIGIFPGLFWPKILQASNVVYAKEGLLDGRAVVLSLNSISVVFAALMALIGLLFFFRWITYRKKDISSAVTWDCGYECPTARMQYTASSFAEPIGTFFRPLFKPSNVLQKLSGIFPKPAVFEEHISDRAEKGVFGPIFNGIGGLLLFVRKRRKSTVQNYLAWIFVTLIVLFLLEVWFGI